MTLEDLLNCSAEKLEKMTDAELLEHFSPYLDITRIDRQTAKQHQKNAGTPKRAPAKATVHQENVNKVKQLAAQFNFDMSFLDE